jgi:hypothetical protein
LETATLALETNDSVDESDTINEHSLGGAL